MLRLSTLLLLVSVLLGQCIVCCTQEVEDVPGVQVVQEYNGTNDTCDIGQQSLTQLVTDEETDDKCQDNSEHKGLPYKHCPKGCTMRIGSNKCIDESTCSDINLLLLIAFAVAGIVLVFFIKIFDITLSQGAIHGLIFYANIVWIYESLYLENSSVKCNFLKVFLAWFNLDFGIEMCLCEKLDLYTKTWLQFIFPLYICVIACLIIILSRYLQCIARILGGNSVQVLAVLFLLSHTKLLCTIATAVQQSNNKNGTCVWGYDSNMTFQEGKYISLFAVAVLLFCAVWLPFTLALLFIQPLRRYSHLRPCRLVDKLKPFFDAYTGAFRPNSHFWVGLLCLVRGVLLFVYVLTQYFHKEQLNSIALVLTIMVLLVVLYCSGGLYIKSTSFNICQRNFKISLLSMLEISFLLNLAALSFVIIFIDYLACSNSQHKVYAFLVSVLLAFLQFAGIFIWHASKQVYSCFQKRRRGSYNDLESNIETETAAPSTTANIVVGNGTFMRSDALIRESILTESTQK